MAKVVMATLMLLIGLQACSQSGRYSSPQVKQPMGDAPSLANVYQDYFRIGAAIDHQSFQTHRTLLTHHFNSVTAENEMKFEWLQPHPGQFDFAAADAMVAFAREHDMAVRGHALVWHRMTPAWVFEDQQGRPVSAEVLRARMRQHITRVMNHFEGHVQDWDVVNEAIMDDGRLRTHLESADDQQSQWYGILGESYIADAFRFAHQADPQAKLFYNDYYNYLPERRDAIYALLKKLLDQGVPIHGVGLQCHLNIQPSDDPEHQSFQQTVENLEKAIQMYASLGLDVHITELDISVYVGGYPYEVSDFFTEETFTAEVQARQAQRYRAFFDMFRRNRDAISNVTFWGVADDNTWLSEFDSGRQDFPMLFDVHHQPKPAFDAVVEFAQ